MFYLLIILTEPFDKVWKKGQQDKKEQAAKKKAAKKGEAGESSTSSKSPHKSHEVIEID